MSPTVRQILVYRNDLLPISETFILAQTGALQSFHPTLVGLIPPRRSLELPSDAILLSPRRSPVSVVRSRLYCYNGIAPRFHTKAAERHPELLHAHFAPDGVAALHLRRTLNLPLIVTLHGYDVTIRRDFARSYGELWETADLFLCISNFIRNKALESGFPAEKLRVHYIGINLDRFCPASQERKAGSVLFVGRLVEKKGCQYLLRAMALVQKQVPQAHATIVGDGPLRLQLEALASELKVRAVFLGAQSSRVVRDLLEHNRVFCVPSVTASNGDSEGFGMVFAEAQAMGVPVVAFDHGGVAEVVQNGVGGLLASERDIEKLAEHLLAYLTDEQLWQKSSARAIEHIHRRFDLATQTRELETIYSKTIAGFHNKS